MKELQEIINAFDAAQAHGKQTALATVVHVEGSSYRRAGARMLVTDDGQLTGAISGGCLEGDALRKARLVMAEQKPMLVTYDTTDDDDAKLGVGLGCNGIIQILIEPINPEDSNNPIALLRPILANRENAVVITVFNMNDRQQRQYGTCMLVNANGTYTGNRPQGIVTDELAVYALQVLQFGDQYNKIYRNANGYTCFIELLQPAIALVIAGAGNDALPLIQMAKVLGWHVTLADGRANYVTAARFPSADTLITARPDELLPQLTIDARTVFMLMTHNFNYDMSLLKNLLPLAVKYIGILGPKKRLSRMLAELAGVEAEDEIAIPANVYGPAGLNLGSEDAGEIALSIIAQIQGVMNNKDAQPLREKGYIHERGVV
ncbi:XdhC family protein [Mucilaginibacter pedocola]|uniref:Alanine dehydrogenase n=1 Tax=Mucilaginibacter pedocola TaxID=1792845 RepID=A0A1S9PMN0_9SPHI|nr:XdhC/CoxI family protein [Mucilaginibacter pedocola]OOQ62213.1 alanine dehydrogenase [Mucilaginibacter pedocola]